MSFQPLFTITRIPRASIAWYLVDATGDSPDNPTGFGAANAPANIAAITSLFGAVQAYGETPVAATATSGNLAIEAEVQVPIADGVNTFIAWYGELKSNAFTISEDRLTLTTTGSAYTNLLDSVDSLGDGTLIIPIISKTANTVVLASAWPGSSSSGTQIYRYFKGTVQALTINRGYGKIVNEIAQVPYRANKLEKALEIIDDITLYESAQYAMGNGYVSLAHGNARLITYNKPAVTNTCKTC